GNEIILHFIVGGAGDDDLSGDGTIAQLGGPGSPDAYTVTNTSDSGPGSLRQAIINANANPFSDITFEIPGPAPHLIQPLSPLPTITSTMTIDGLALPPSEAGFNLEATTPQVEIDGSLAGPGADGLTIDSQFSTVQGLDISRFSGDGIL